MTRTTTATNFDEWRELDFSALSEGDRVHVVYEANNGNQKEIFGEVSDVNVHGRRVELVTDDGKRRLIVEHNEYEMLTIQYFVGEFGCTTTMGNFASMRTESCVTFEHESDDDADDTQELVTDGGDDMGGRTVKGVWCHPNGGARITGARPLQEKAARFESEYNTVWLRHVGAGNYELMQNGETFTVGISQAESIIDAHTPEQTATMPVEDSPFTDDPIDRGEGIETDGGRDVFPYRFGGTGSPPPVLGPADSPVPPGYPDPVWYSVDPFLVLGCTNSDGPIKN